MQNLSKKGFSSIIQVSIISALSINAIFMIFAYIKDLSKGLENQLSPTVDCINQQSKITSACLNSDGKVELSVNTALGEKINYLNINIDRESFLCDKYCKSCTILESENKNKVYISPESTNPQSLIASINNCNPQQFQIRPC